MKIIKRNGSEATFDIVKIIAAVTKANNVVAEDERLMPMQIRRIAESVENSCLHLCIGNNIAPEPAAVESNKIGLRTCERIMQQLGGSFLKYEQGGCFTAELLLPALPDTEPETAKN